QQLIPIELSKLKSAVWEHFTKIKANDVVKVKCNYCKRLLGGHSSNGTLHLKSHVKSCLQKKILDGYQGVLGPNYVSQGKKELVATRSQQFPDEICHKPLHPNNSSCWAGLIMDLLPVSIKQTVKKTPH
ncbi:hypothetical protein LINGRAHAP2_LOCUS31233, partial [Linum grandiflorum]